MLYNALKARAFLFAGTAIAASIATSAMASEAQYSILPQDLSSALKAFGQQSGETILYRKELTGSTRSPGAVGKLEPEAALSRILSGSQFEFRKVDSGFVVVPSNKSEAEPTARLIKAVVMQGSAPAAPIEAPPPPTAVAIEEVVVTGTSIRGVAPVGSDLISVGRDHIEKTGAVDTAQLLSTIPQLNTFAAVPEGQDKRSRTQGYALNIHNLGYYATLTLINGHRYAPAGGEVSFVDAAMIPSIAIGRVELVPDGASGVYGSDAVAGVVNFVYRGPFTGLEANAEYGWGTGSNQSAQLSAIAGKQWDTGSLSLALEYSRRAPPTYGELGIHSDHSAEGRRDLRASNCAPGNVTVDGKAYALPNFTTPINKCEINPDQQLFADGTRYTALMQGRKDLGDNLELNFDATYGHFESQRLNNYATLVVDVPRTNPYFQAPPGSTANTVRVTRNTNGLFPTKNSVGWEQEFGLTGGAIYRLPNDWAVNFLTHYSQDENYTTEYAPFSGLDFVTAQKLANGTTRQTAFNPFGNAADNDPSVLAQIDDGYYNRNWAKNRLLQVSLKADGPLFEIPGGPVKAAIGVDYRFEDIHQIQDYGTTTYTQIVRDTLVERKVYAAYGELNVPLVSSANALPLIRSLQFQLSARHDRYPGLKNVTNPKIGGSWKPFNDLTVQGSWGKSFVAPNLGALGGSYLIPFIQTNQAAAGLGIINLIHIGGGNAHLNPEYAENTSFGFKYSPAWIPGFNAGLTYWHVDYENTQYQPQEGLTDPAFAEFLSKNYPPGVIRKATPADVAALTNVYGYKFQGIFPEGTVWDSITTSALVNAGTLYARGWDFNASYSLASEQFGRFDAIVNGTRITTYDFKLLPDRPAVSKLDTNQAPRWKVSPAVNWALGPFSTNVTYNFVSSYNNISVAPIERVEAYKTVDVRVAYELPILAGTQISFRVQNLFDKPAPYFASANGYDQRMASPLGRVMQVALRAKY